MRVAFLIAAVVTIPGCAGPSPVSPWRQGERTILAEDRALAGCLVVEAEEGWAAATTWTFAIRSSSSTPRGASSSAIPTPAPTPRG